MMDFCRRAFVITLAVLLVAAPRVAMAAGEPSPAAGPPGRESCTIGRLLDASVGCLFLLVSAPVACNVIPSPLVSGLLGRGSDYASRYIEEAERLQNSPESRKSCWSWENFCIVTGVVAGIACLIGAIFVQKQAVSACNDCTGELGRWLDAFNNGCEPGPLAW